MVNHSSRTATQFANSPVDSEAIRSTARTRKPAQSIPPRKIAGPCCLSFPQERIWFWYQLDPLSPVYNVPVGLRIRGDLDLCALQKSLDHLVARHEALRTRYSFEGGTPVQVIEPPRSIELGLTDISSVPDGEGERQLLSLATDEARRPFDLSRDLLLRGKLFRLSDTDHALVLTMHHISSDGWSVGVLLRELSSAYTTYWADLSPDLPALPIQYADFADWQRRTARGNEWESLLNSWTERIGRDFDPLHIRTDNRRPPKQTFRGGRESIVLAPPLVDALKALGQSRKSSLFMTLLAALQVLLYRCSGHQRIAVGFPVADRNRTETASLIGFFGNTLVSCNDLSGDPTFLEFLAQVRESTLSLYEHQDLPFETLVEHLHPQRSLSKPPVFQTLLVCEDGLMPRTHWPGLEVDRFDVHTSTAKFDLSLLVEEKDGLEVIFEYNSDLFTASTIQGLSAHFHTLLEELVNDPGRRVSSIPILSQSERTQMLVDWNQTERPYQHRCVHELVEAQVERTPDAPAVRFNDQQLSYRELNGRANALSIRLRNLGVGIGSRVGVMMTERNTDVVVALLAILKAGAAYVPLDPKLPRERLQFLIEDAGISVLVTQSSIEVTAVSTLRLIALDSSSHEESQAGNPACEGDPSNLAYVIYTSGSTGVPKGVAIPHRGIVRLLDGQGFARFGPRQVFLQFAPLWFDLSTLEIWGPLLHGGQCVLFPSTVATAGELGCALRKFKVTTLWLTASMFNVIIDEAHETLAVLDQLIIGGEALSPSHVRRALKLLPGVEIINGYGPTENTTFTTTYRIPRDLPENINSIPIGRPIANTTIYILDGHLQPVPVGVAGELYTGGPGLALGYLNRPALTSERFIRNPFADSPHELLYNTGDLARYLPDGNIEFLGRRDDQVKIHGCRIELGEIEAILNAHPKVKNAAVIACAHPDGTNSLVAHLVPRTHHSGLADDVKAFLQCQLPDYMVPAKLVIQPHLPLLSNGKVDRRALAVSVVPELPTRRFMPPRDAVETELINIWQRVLETRPIGTTDNFFALGGHSLSAVRVMTAIERRFGRKMDVSTLLSAQTVEQLAARLRNTPGPNS